MPVPAGIGALFPDFVELHVDDLQGIGGNLLAAAGTAGIRTVGGCAVCFGGRRLFGRWYQRVRDIHHKGGIAALLQ